MIRTILEATGHDGEVIELRGKTVSPCRLCFRCKEDDICKTEDAMALWRRRILDADAFVVGGAAYSAAMNAATYAFLERLAQFGGWGPKRLREKPGVAVGIRWSDGQDPAEEIERQFGFHGIEIVAKVTLGPAAGRPGRFPRDTVGKAVLNSARAAGKTLAARLAGRR